MEGLTPGAISNLSVTPEKSDRMRLDPSLLQAVLYLFPKERGMELLTLLLRYATVKQVVKGAGGEAPIAVIRLQSVEAFARQYGWGKDTMLRYIAILEALHILQRYRYRDGTELHVSCSSWSPGATELAALDRLLMESTTRAKLQQLAKGVRARFLLLYGPPQARSSLFDDIQSTLTDVTDLFNKRLTPATRQLLQLRLENLKLRLETETQKGDFPIRCDTNRGD